VTDITTTARVKRQLNIGTLVTTDDDLIADYVTQASQAIEDLCKRTLIAANGTLQLDAIAPYRIGRKVFFQEEVLGVYSVVNGDGTTVDPANYRLLPYNRSPKYGLELTVDSGLYWTWSLDPKGAITVAGTIGAYSSASLPTALTLVATKYAAWLYQNRDNQGGVIRFADGSVQIPPDVPSWVMDVLTRGRYVRDMLYLGEPRS
jgi:hypothetical protein